ncbi:nuclear factor erythroid 2-related factor 2a [Aplochiton taeniatus]
MMEIEMPKIHPSQQDMELIDILWMQDIDLGARREVFDYSHRQKEHERQRQLELEKEKRSELLREQEKALLAELQLDAETGEFVPCTAPSSQLQSAGEALKVTQNVSFSQEDGGTMSFDECMQLLEDTFPLVETSQTTSACLDAAVVPAPNTSRVMIAPEQPDLSQAPLLPAPLPPQRTSPDLEQAWMELLSLPELQQCLNMQMEDTLEVRGYLPTNNNPEVQDPNYSFYPMPNMAEARPNPVDVCAPEFINVFDEAFPIAASPEHLGQMTLKAPELNTSFSDKGFSEMYYPNMLNTKVSSGVKSGFEKDVCGLLPNIPYEPPFKPVDMHNNLSPAHTFERIKQEVVAEFPDSDSGVSLNTSPNASSPEKSMCGDGSFGYSDSDMEEMDSNPGSAESDYSEMFSLNFQPDSFQPLSSVSDTSTQRQKEQQMKHHKSETTEENGPNSHPFTKDKMKKRSEMRLSRDEQRAKALQIPFTVDMIINLPVDDFNELMSKDQLNEPQLALVRDIRRRGKNKVAAQNCRKRKMESIVGLEYDLDSLKDEKERLKREKSQNSSSLREMKQQLNSLYLEVFSMLRDEEGLPYSPSDYSLKQTTDGSVFLVPRIKKTLCKNKDN